MLIIILTQQSKCSTNFSILPCSSSNDLFDLVLKCFFWGFFGVFFHMILPLYHTTDTLNISYFKWTINPLYHWWCSMYQYCSKIYFFALYNFTLVSIDNLSVSVKRFRINNIHSFSVLFSSQSIKLYFLWWWTHPTVWKNEFWRIAITLFSVLTYISSMHHPMFKGQCFCFVFTLLWQWLKKYGSIFHFFPLPPLLYWPDRWGCRKQTTPLQRDGAICWLWGWWPIMPEDWILVIEQSVTVQYSTLAFNWARQALREPWFDQSTGRVLPCYLYD